MKMYYTTKLVCLLRTQPSWVSAGQWPALRPYPSRGCVECVECLEMLVDSVKPPINSPHLRSCNGLLDLFVNLCLALPKPWITIPSMYDFPKNHHQISKDVNSDIVFLSLSFRLLFVFSSELIAVFECKWLAGSEMTAEQNKHTSQRNLELLWNFI